MNAVIISNAHYGAALVVENPQLTNAVPPFSGEPGGPEVLAAFAEWWRDPLRFEVSWTNLYLTCRQRNFTDIVFGNQRFAVFSERSTPERFLDFPHVEVVFVREPHGLGWTARPAAEHGGDRYWLCVIPSDPADIAIIKPDDKMKIVASRARSGLARLRFTECVDRTWHIRLPAPLEHSLIAVSPELWEHWQAIGATGILDALAIPEHRHIQKLSVKDLESPWAKEEGPPIRPFNGGHLEPLVPR